MANKTLTTSYLTRLSVAKPTVALGKSRMLKLRTANDSNGTNGESWRLPPCGQLRIYSFHSLYSPTQKNESPTNTSICRQGKEHLNSDALFLSANDSNKTNGLFGISNNENKNVFIWYCAHLIVPLCPNKLLHIYLIN